MDMFDELAGRDAGEDMARASAKPLDHKLIDEFVSQLKGSLADSEMFKSIIGMISDHPSMSAQEVIEISHRFLGGTKPKSRKAALTAISQERLRLTHARAKAATAAKSKVW